MLNSNGLRFLACTLSTLCVSVLVLATSASANTVQNDPVFGLDGSDPDFPSIGYELPLGSPLNPAGNTGGGFPDIEYDESVCFYLQGSTTCQANLPAAGVTPYSLAVTYTITALNVAQNASGVLLVIESLGLPMGYSIPDAGIAVAGAPIGAQTFDPLSGIEDNAFGPGFEYYYLGWLVTSVGETFTLRIDVADQLASGNPFPVTSSAPIFNVVPEPGTALLLGLGLAGLAAAGRPRWSA